MVFRHQITMSTKYWEMGFFYPDYTSTNDKSKYFMMVNKRCVPDMIDKEGDVRQLKIEFDSTDLSGYNNWILSDMNTGISKVFDKRNQGTGGFLDMGSTQGTLGYFLPGEGKLYKLAPLMQEAEHSLPMKTAEDLSLSAEERFLTGMMFLSSRRQRQYCLPIHLHE